MPSPDDVAAFDTKVCPYCAEVIKAAAIKCRFCQSDLTVPAPVAPAAAPSAPKPEPQSALPSAPPSAPSSSTAGRRPRSVSIRTMSFRQEPDGSLTPTTPPTPTRSAAPRTPAPAVIQEVGDDEGSRRRWGVLATGVALLLVIAFLALAFLDWRSAREIAASEEAGRTVQASVTDKVEALLSYDYKTFDEDLAAAREGMTAGFQDEYEPTVAEIRDRAIAQKRSQEADVVAVAVVSQTPDEIETLVFVNTLSSREGVRKQRLMPNRVNVTMVKQDGTWLIDELSVPQS